MVLIPSAETGLLHALPHARLPETAPRSLRVTVIEDEPTMTEMLHDLIAEDATVTAVSGPESLRSVSDTMPDVIVIGLAAAGDFGAWELVSSIRQHRLLSGLPIILCSVDVDPHVCAGSLCVDGLAGHSDVHVVRMPCDGEQVLELIRELRTRAA